MFPSPRKVHREPKRTFFPHITLNFELRPLPTNATYIISRWIESTCQISIYFRSTSSTTIVQTPRQTHIRPTAPPVPLNWSVITRDNFSCLTYFSGSWRRSVNSHQHLFVAVDRFLNCSDSVNCVTIGPWDAVDVLCMIGLHFSVSCVDEQWLSPMPSVQQISLY